MDGRETVECGVAENAKPPTLDQSAGGIDICVPETSMEVRTNYRKIAPKSTPNPDPAEIARLKAAKGFQTCCDNNPGNGQRNERLCLPARLAHEAGLTFEDGVAKLSSAWGYGQHEEWEVRRAFAQFYEGKAPEKKDHPKSIITNPPKVFSRIISKSDTDTFTKLRELSPWPVHDDPVVQVCDFLKCTYMPGDLIFIGDKVRGIYESDDAKRAAGAGNIRSQEEWIEFFMAGNPIPPQFCINPLTGECFENDKGQMSHRLMECVEEYPRFALLEMDKAPLRDQLKFFSEIPLPLRSITFSGGKSLHAILDVQEFAPDLHGQDEWQRIIVDGLHHKRLKALGVDASCSDVNHLSRMPGHLRLLDGGESRMQQLLWLSPEGRSVR